MASKTKNILILISSVVILATSLWWLTFLLFQKLPSQKSKLYTSSQDLKNIFYKLSDTKEYNNAMKFAKSTTAVINSLFVSRKGALSFIKILEKNAAKNNLQLKIKKIDGSSGNSDNFLRLNLDLTGLFNNIYQFIGGIESYPYFIIINNINIHRAEESTQTRVKTLKKSLPAIVTATIIIDVLTQK